jgi:cellulose synthase/poly-beta-1,6-N-acetylglucosamine synthase-like glycosyltransferase
VGPLVSILIPCYNAERWIAQAIESALAQTWLEKEIIVVVRIPPNRWRSAIERRLNNWRRSLRLPGSEIDWHFWDRYPFTRNHPGRFVSQSKPVDFCRGPAELADAIEEKRPCRLSAQLGWHITELIESLQYPERFGFQRKICSSFNPIQPLPPRA